MKESATVKVADLTFKPLIPAETIAARIHELGQQIAKDYAGKTPVLLGVLKGSTMFLSDLSRAIDTDCTLSFMKVSSYHGGTSSTGEIKRDMTLNEDLKDRHILIIEDIVDTGNTAVFLFNELQKSKPASVKMATLLFKPAAMKHDFKPDYVAFEIGNEFVVGYGLDYNELGRNLPHIYVLSK
jgi:hypoxanthine phosphoribosyltransferase